MCVCTGVLNHFKQLDGVNLRAGVSLGLTSRGTVFVVG